MLSKLSVPDRSRAPLCVHFPRRWTTMGTFGETEARSPTYPLLRRNNQVGSLLKFFALTYALTWACFLAAIAISNGTASAVPALTAGPGLLLVLGPWPPPLTPPGAPCRDNETSCQQ